MSVIDIVSVGVSVSVCVCSSVNISVSVKFMEVLMFFMVLELV